MLTAETKFLVGNLNDSPTHELPNPISKQTGSCREGTDPRSDTSGWPCSIELHVCSTGILVVGLKSASRRLVGASVDSRCFKPEHSPMLGKFSTGMSRLAQHVRYAATSGAARSSNVLESQHSPVSAGPVIKHLAPADRCGDDELGRLLKTFPSVDSLNFDLYSQVSDARLAELLRLPRIRRLGLSEDNRDLCR